MNDFIDKTTRSTDMMLFVSNIYMGEVFKTHGEWLNLDVRLIFEDIEKGEFDFINKHNISSDFKTVLTIKQMFGRTISIGQMRDANYEISDWEVMSYFNSIMIHLLHHEIISIDNYTSSKYTLKELPKFINQIVSTKAAFLAKKEQV